MRKVVIRISAKKKVLFSIVVIIGLLLLMELICRLVLLVFGGNSPSEVMGAITLDPVFHHVWTPNHTEVCRARTLPYERRVNSRGWVEDYEISKAKPIGTYRIFYVGDSNTEGVVPAGERMVDIVERRLKEIYASLGIRMEVVNAGVSSYSPLLYYLAIREKILKFSPDLVVVNVDMTDAVNDASYAAYIVRDVDGGIVGVSAVDRPPTGYCMMPRGLVRLRGWDLLSDWLVNHSAFCAQFKKLLGGNGMGLMKLPSEIDADWLALKWTKGTEDNVDKTISYLGKIVKLLDRHGVKLLVTGVPHYPQYAGKWSTRPHKALARGAVKYGYDYFNSYEGLKSAIKGTRRDKYYWPKDPTHFNAAGNKLWAALQLRELLSKPGLLPKRESSTGKR